MEFHQIFRMSIPPAQALSPSIEDFLVTVLAANDAVRVYRHSLVVEIRGRWGRWSWVGTWGKLKHCSSTTSIEGALLPTEPKGRGSLFSSSVFQNNCSVTYYQSFMILHVSTTCQCHLLYWTIGERSMRKVTVRHCAFVAGRTVLNHSAEVVSLKTFVKLSARQWLRNDVKFLLVWNRSFVHFHKRCGCLTSRAQTCVGTSIFFARLQKFMCARTAWREHWGCSRDLNEVDVAFGLCESPGSVASRRLTKIKRGLYLPPESAVEPKCLPSSVWENAI